MGGYTHLDAESSVYLRLALVVLPDDAELDDALGDLHNVERLLVFCSAMSDREVTRSEI